MSVENRIFWLLVGILCLWIVFSVTGRAAIARFVGAVFGVTPAPSQGISLGSAGIGAGASGGSGSDGIGKKVQTITGTVSN